MLTKEKAQAREQVEFHSIEDFVPKNHLLRDIDRTMSFDFIYDEVKDLYCLDNGRPSIDPVVLFKIVLVKYLFGIRSMRQIIKEIEVNMAYRWFLGYGMTKRYHTSQRLGRITNADLPTVTSLRKFLNISCWKQFGASLWMPGQFS